MGAATLTRATLTHEGAPTGYLRPAGLSKFTQADLQLSLLHRPGTLIELRAKGPHGGMVQSWHSNPQAAATDALSIAEHTDVYVGVLPRLRRSGGKDSVASASVVWVECDSPHSVERVLSHEHQPNMVICSSSGRCHAYWSLTRELTPEHIEQACKRLAWHLGGDMKATDSARILRVAGTRNHKRAESQAVFLAHFGGMNVDPRDLVGELTDPTPPPSAAARPTRPKLADPTRAALKAVAADQYVSALTGREVSRGMVCCPFHKGGEERTPSLHVTGVHDALWHCFGCGEGSDIFGFAARLWGMNETADFPAIVKRLTKELGV